MNKNFIAFNELLRKDAHLQNQLKAATNEEAFVKLYCQLAKGKGYDIPPQEVKEYLKKIKANSGIKHVLNQEELRQIAGGDCPTTEPGTDPKVSVYQAAGSCLGS